MVRLVKIAVEVMSVLKQLKEIKAIAIYGGVARGFVDKYSDVDIICLCSKIPDKKKRVNKIKSLKNSLIKEGLGLLEFEERSDYFTLKNTNIGIYYILIHEYKKLVHNFKNSKKLTKAEFSNVLAHIYYTKVLYDPQKFLQNLKNGIPSPNIKTVNYFTAQLNKTCYKADWPYGDKIYVESQRKNPISLNARFTELLDAYLISLFTLNGQYYTGPKWIREDIKNFKIKPKNCLQRIETVAYLGNSKKNIKRKLKTLTSLVKDLNLSEHSVYYPCN